MADELTDKEKRFCDEYLIDLNATAAYARAGYTGKSNGVLRTGAHKLLTKANIQVHIQELMQKRSNRVQIDQDRVVKELATVAFLDPARFYTLSGDLRNIKEMEEDVRRVIQSIESFEEWEGTGDDKHLVGHTKKLKFWDKLKALELVGKHLGMWKDKVEVTGTNGQPIQVEPVTDAQAMARISNVFARLGEANIGAFRNGNTASIGLSVGRPISDHDEGGDGPGPVADGPPAFRG